MASAITALRSNIVPIDPSSTLSSSTPTPTPPNTSSFRVSFGNRGIINRPSLGGPLFFHDEKKKKSISTTTYTSGRVRKVVQCLQEESSTPIIDIPSITRKDFPPGFLFGASTSSAQIEGAYAEGGKTLSIWDVFSRIPGKIAEGASPDIACDHYHKYKDDVKLMKEIGLDSYRFSISWCRILPDGIHENPEGIKFYNNLIDELVHAGITPFVTIFHYDIPNSLDTDPSLKGWRGDGIVDKYALFAETCFKHFGDRVKYWITHNEMHIFSIFGYGTGAAAPGRCSEISGGNCEAGDSSTEPYIVFHNLLKAHARACKIYKTKYQSHQKGKIGITIDATWCEPYSGSKEDQDAAQRYMEFESGWQIDPLFTGDYPNSMRERVGNRLPQFTQQESEDLERSCDFLGVNYYTSRYVKNGLEITDPSKKWWENDMGATAADKNALGQTVGAVMGPPTIPWLRNAPWGLSKLLKWLKNRYGDVPLYITENGCTDPNSKDPIEEILNDNGRITYISQHMENVANSIKNDDVNLKGYFVWSLMDNFEWASGYTGRFGLIYCDFENGQKRTLKDSSKWYKLFLSTKDGHDANHGNNGHHPPTLPWGNHGH